MKKFLVVLIIAAVALTSVFAGFNIFDLNINVRPVGVLGYLGASYEIGKWEFGVEGVSISPVVPVIKSFTDNSATVSSLKEYIVNLNQNIGSAYGTSTNYGISGFVSYEILKKDKVEMAAGVYTVRSFNSNSSGYGLSFGFLLDSSLKIKENNSLTGRLTLDIPKFISTTSDTIDVIMNNGELVTWEDWLTPFFYSSIGCKYSF